MVRASVLLFGAALALGACGGSVSKDGESGGGGGSGAAGGSGGGSGGGPLCCTSKADCYSGKGGEGEGPPAPVECVQGVCKGMLMLGPSECWQDSDCQYGMCIGAFVCPCGSDCHDEDQPGTCMAPTPSPSPACCTNDLACGDYAYSPCVNGVCKLPVPGACWKNEECPAGQTCVGASVCPCGALCDEMDMPGKCL